MRKKAKQVFDFNDIFKDLPDTSSEQQNLLKNIFDQDIGKSFEIEMQGLRFGKIRKKSKIPVIDAIIFEKSLEEIKKLIAENPNHKNEKTPERESNALLCATFHHDKKNLIPFLIDECGYSIEDTDKNQNNVLFFLTNHYDSDFLQEFIDKYKIGREYINRKNKFGSTALFFACHQGNIKTIDTLIENGIDPSIRSNGGKNGQSILHYMMRARINVHTYEIICKMVEKHGADINEIYDGRNLLHSFFMFNDMYSRGGTEILGYLIKSGLDINATTDISGKPKQTPLAILCSRENISNDNYKMIDNYIKILLENGASQKDTDMDSSTNNTPLALLTKYSQYTNEGYEKLAMTLIDYGADINYRTDKKKSVLHIAMKRKTPDNNVKIDFLIKNGAEINFKYLDDYAPNYIGKFSWDEDDTTNDKNKEAVDYDKFPVLIQAIRNYSQSDTIKCLIKNGADINFVSSFKQTVLNVACWYCKTDTIEYLLENSTIKKTINIPDKHGNTPLITIVLTGKENNKTDTAKSVYLLIQSGADTSIRNNKNETVFDMVKKDSPEYHVLQNMANKI